MLDHGGRVRLAAAKWGIPAERWLDLSTGIAPLGYPVPPIAADCWRRLPEDDDGLLEAAAAYYGTSRLLALPGSQAAIQALPRLRRPGTAAVLATSYGEHAAAWHAAGHALLPYCADELAAVAAAADTVVVCNPNNPDAARFAQPQLLAAARALERRGGWLVIDEAFADAEAEQSLASVAGSDDAENVIVLRSLGKFFGLAGARVGFAIAAAPLLQALGEALGPWTVAGPARAAALAALADAPWQTQQRDRLRNASARLAQLLAHNGLEATAGTALFRYVVTPRAPEIFAALARQGILVRQFADPPALRFGLPGDEPEWQRLAAALALAMGGSD